MRSATHFTKWLFLAAELCFAHSSFALDNVTLQLNWTHGFQFAGYYAAKELGYYEESGLNVSLEESVPNAESVTNIIAGKAQFGVGNSSLLMARAAGKPVVVLAAIFQHSPYVIYTAQNIENISALAGKKILLDSQSDELLAYLKQEGITADQTQFQSQHLDLQDLISGRIDAISGNLFNRPYAFDLANFSYRTFTPRMAGIDFYGDNLFTSEDELSKHPERVRAFLQASLRGWRYARDHQEEIISLILKKYSTHYSREYLKFESAQTMQLLQSDLVDIGYSIPMRWQRMTDIYTKAGMLPKSFSLSGFLYTPRSVSANESPAPAVDFRSLIFPLLLLGLIILFSIYIHLINRKLKQNSEKLNTLSQHGLISSHVLNLLTTDATLTKALEAILANIQLIDNSALCSIVLVNTDGTQLRLGTAPSCLLKPHNNLGNSTDICLCAATLKTGKRTVVKSIHDNPLCSECKEIAAQAGLTSCWAEPITSSDGKPTGVLTIFHRESHEASEDDVKLMKLLADLSSVAVAQIQSKQLLQKQYDLLTKVSAEIPGIIFQFRRYPDGHSCFPFISEAVRKMYGITPEDLREDATPFFAFRHPDDAHRLEEAINESARSLSRWHIEYRLILPGQGTRWRLGDAMPERIEDGSILWHGFITDITERKNAEERIHHMAQYDALTDLPNRALLNDRLQQTLSNAKREQEHLALMFIDFDNFKQINDSLGHAIGDKLLVKSAIRMQGCLRESDTIARIGGDEFVILLPHAESGTDAQLVAEKVRKAIDIPFGVDGYTLNSTISIGIAIYPEHGEDEIQLSKSADCAMYQAKQHGRNRVEIYHDQMQVIGQ